MQFRLLYIFFLLFPVVAAAADRVPPVAVTDSLVDDLALDSASCVLPFTRAGNLILLKARVDSTEGNFVLDTGAPGLVLNITYFRDYPTTEHHDANQTSINGTGQTVLKTLARELSLGTLDYHRVEADLVDLGHIENTKGVRILGLLGMDLLKQCEMIIDYEKNLIYLHRIARKEASSYRHALLVDTADYRTVPIELVDGRVITSTTLAGKKLKLVIDCAAESNILDSRLPNKIFEQVTITRRVVLRGSDNSKVDALFGDLRNLQLGRQDIGTLPVLITSLERSCFSYAGCVDGVLGFDFLSLHKVGFNFVNRKMYIWK